MMKLNYKYTDQRKNKIKTNSSILMNKISKKKIKILILYKIMTNY